MNAFTSSGDSLNHSPLARRSANLRCQGLTQDELAAEAGMRRSYLSDLERGVRNPSVHTLGRLAAALKVEAVDLLRRV